MSKDSSIFIKIDEFIFQKLDFLKNEGVFQKFNDAISALDENQQKIVAQITTFTFLVIPFVFVGLLWWGNAQSKKNLETKKQIIEQIGLLDGNKNTLTNISSNYLSPVAIMTQDDLDNKMRNLLSINSIDQQKVQVSNFRQGSSTSSVAKVEADITFKDFGTSDFSNFMRGLIETERFKVLSVNLIKNRESNLLNGSISLMHLGQNTYSQQE